MSGKLKISATASEWLRITLIGQQPRPAVSAARMKLCMTSAASTAALKNPSSLPFCCSMAADLADPFEAAGVAAKHQKHRRITDPRHFRDERGETIAAAAVRNPNDGGLLEIRFRGG